MRTLFFRAMALVLGLFTVTAAFALTFEDAIDMSEKNTGTYRYLHDEEAALTGWDDPNNWESGNSPSCGDEEETICQVDIGTFATIDAYLQDLKLNQGVTTYSAFTGLTEVEMGEEPQ